MNDISNRVEWKISGKNSILHTIRLMIFAVAFFSVFALTKTESYAAEEYPIWVGGVQVTSENKDNITSDGIIGHVSYEPDPTHPDTGTLILDNATITGTYQDFSNRQANIFVEDTFSLSFYLTIKLIGDNKMTGQYGIWGDNTCLNIIGGGALAVTADETCMYSNEGYLDLDNVTLSLKGNKGLGREFGYGHLNIKNSRVDAVTDDTAILVLNVIENSIINVRSTKKAAIYSGETIEIKGDSLVVAESESTLDNGLYRYGIYCPGLALNDNIIIQEPAGGSFDANEKTIMDSNNTVAAKVILANDATYQNYKTSLINNTTANINKPTNKENTSSSHVHSFSWVVTKYPTSTSDGEEAYQCSCGEIAQINILPAISAFEEETINKIKNAPANGVVEVETRLFNSFGIGVRDALIARPDVTLKVSFLSEGHKGIRLKVTIPTGINRSELWDKDGWLGLCRAGSTLGYDKD